jgi:hypothetical protein
MSIYTKKGYQDRADYINTLAQDFGLEYDAVLAVADLLGPEEDFDGLVSACEDLEDGGAEA